MPAASSFFLPSRGVSSMMGSSKSQADVPTSPPATSEIEPPSEGDVAWLSSLGG